MLNSKIVKEKKSPFIIYADFESILVPEDNETKIQKSLIQTDIKKILLVVMTID